MALTSENFPAKIITCINCLQPGEKTATVNVCSSCLPDYRYNVYRKNLHKKQMEAGKFLSHEGKRWSKPEMRALKNAIKSELLTGTHTEIRARKICDVFEITRSLANKILQELMRDGLITKKGFNRETYYEVIK